VLNRRCKYIFQIRSKSNLRFNKYFFGSHKFQEKIMKHTHLQSSKKEAHQLYSALIGFTLALALFLWLTGTLLAKAAPSYGRHDITLPSMAIQNDTPVLVFASNDAPKLTIANISQSSENGKAYRQLETQNEIQLSENVGEMQIGQMSAAPGGIWAALDIVNGSDSSTWILNLGDGRMSPILKDGTSQFLGWHPDGNQLIVNIIDSSEFAPGLWLFDVQNGKHSYIDIPKLSPGGLLDAAISPDGNLIAYSFSRGFGFGSKLWLMDLASHSTKQVLFNKYGIAAHVLWSPDGNQIIVDMIPDSSVPFAQSGLWIVNPDGSGLELLSTMDGGRGQQPLFSNDGKTLYFVDRDNPKDNKANYDSKALISSIHAVDLATRESRVLVTSDGANQFDLALSADGNIYFVTTRSGNSEIWVLDSSGQLGQITSDGQSKRHPIIISSH
jgi:Tol biopolymer transport system component